MKRLFISYSSNDQERVKAFLDFLILGMGIQRNVIFCTLQNGSLPTGQPFTAEIRKQLISCEKIICFITPSYLHSKFCLIESGAAWCQTHKIIPLLVEPLQYQDLNDTPLIGMQMLKRNRLADLTTLYEELYQSGIATNAELAEFNRQANRYLQQTTDRSISCLNNQYNYEVLT